MRVMVRHGFSRDMADLLLEDVKRSSLPAEASAQQAGGCCRGHHLHTPRPAEDQGGGASKPVWP